MRCINIIYIISFLIYITSCTTDKEVGEFKDINELKSKWESYNFQDFQFVDMVPESNGSKIYHSLIDDPASFIKNNAIRVLETLYFTPNDSIPPRENIHYSLKYFEDPSSKYGDGKTIAIVYSTEWVEKTFNKSDSIGAIIETKGILLHELTHAYQLEPLGCGVYNDFGEYFAYVEGVADAVRILNNGFYDNKPKRGGNYLDGFQTTGYFISWIVNNKDKDFLRKFNRSAVQLNPWSFKNAFNHIYKNNYLMSFDNLWNEYQKSI